MKKLIVLAFMSMLTVNSFANEIQSKAVESVDENTRLCELFKDKVTKYEAGMRNDGLAEATLDSYKERMNKFCNTTKPQPKKAEVSSDTRAKQVAAKITNTGEDARLCKVFASKVEIYEASMRKDDLAEATLVSYKDRMSKFCGTSTVKS
jgi:hypothetical protein